MQIELHSASETIAATTVQDAYTFDEELVLRTLDELNLLAHFQFTSTWTRNQSHLDENIHHKKCTCLLRIRHMTQAVVSF